MTILQMVKEAQAKLRSTQENWHEQCLFECDDILTKIIKTLDVCHWDHVSGELWVTECAMTYRMNGTPAEMNGKTCPHCGRVVVVEGEEVKS